MKNIILILLFTICKNVIAQPFVANSDTTLNFTDVTGKRQGKWIILNKTLHKSEYKEDQKVEEGKYIDSKKTGIWKEYYPIQQYKK